MQVPRRHKLAPGGDPDGGALAASAEISSGEDQVLMAVAKRLLAVFLVLIGIAVAVNFILTPVYNDGTTDYPIWRILNWFMVAAAMVILVVGFRRRRDPERADVSAVEYLRGTFAYYGSIVLIMLMLWEWYWTLNPSSESGDAVTAHLIYFPFVNALFVVLALANGRYLWNEADVS